MRWIKWMFYVIGVYGLLVTVPMFFNEQRMGEDYPPPINHPEFYYGFAGAVAAWQLIYLLIGTDPARYRPVILIAILVKLSFATAVGVLYAQQRAPGLIFGLSMVDAAMAVMFIVAWLRVPASWPGTA